MHALSRWADTLGKKERVDIVLAVLGCLSGFVGGWFGGYRLGILVREKPAWLYWLLNVLAVLIGLAGDFLGLVFGQPWLWIASISLLVATLTGLKYGRGKVAGRGSLTRPEPEERDTPSVWED